MRLAGVWIDRLIARPHGPGALVRRDEPRTELEQDAPLRLESRLLDLGVLVPLRLGDLEFPRDLEGDPPERPSSLFLHLLEARLLAEREDAVVVLLLVRALPFRGKGRTVARADLLRDHGETRDPRGEA